MVVKETERDGLSKDRINGKVEEGERWMEEKGVAKGGRDRLIKVKGREINLVT